ncbi:MAG: hypothetical protein IK137_02735 [Bacilli bacterium]|nr:hypothetical protein [Bacilli bacterium]
MKIEKLNVTDYKIYYYKKQLDEKSLYNDIKELIKKVQKRLKLKGFYKVLAVNKKIGLFLILKKIEDNFYRNTLDFKIEISDLDVYFKTNDYFVIKDLSDIKYKDGMFYCVVDESFDKILEKVEFGDFLVGYDDVKLVKI